ncbi:MAG: hypothetical protein OEU32_08415 [Acidimicrobiia bacterium]|nr:hypothetical protein [Acidimicrobiia bacterium]
MKRLFRRLLVLVGIAGIASVIAKKRQERDRAAAPVGEAEWPPLAMAGTSAQGSTNGSAGETASAGAESADEPATDQPWVPSDDGACPASHPVKGNENSGIYHVPGGLAYERTRAERCYISPEAAEADGYRASKA